MIEQSPKLLASEEKKPPVGLTREFKKISTASCDIMRSGEFELFLQVWVMVGDDENVRFSCKSFFCC